MASLLARAPAAPPPADVEQDLVLDREELRMLEIFDRSFQLPGLRLGLLKPICSEDYYPEDETQCSPILQKTESSVGLYCTILTAYLWWSMQVRLPPPACPPTPLLLAPCPLPTRASPLFHPVLALAGSSSDRFQQILQEH